MISKNLAKFIQSLHHKKYRKQHGAFLVEGAKSVRELLSARHPVRHLLVTEPFYEKLPDRLAITPTVVSAEALSRVGTFRTNPAALAVADIPPNEPLPLGPTEYALALDQVRDPGNLGTIVRTADWYGINKIICSTDCADLYNPRVVAATMGSFLRVRLFYTDLADYARRYAAGRVVGTFMHGPSVHEVAFPPSGLLVLGNEARGLGDALAAQVTHPLTIPRYGGAESLNVALATAVVCDNLRRQVG